MHLVNRKQFLATAAGAVAFAEERRQTLYQLPENEKPLRYLNPDHHSRIYRADALARQPHQSGGHRPCGGAVLWPRHGPGAAHPQV